MNKRVALTSVLVADDHPAVVEAVADVLTEQGIEVAGRARDGIDAVEQIELRKPTVAILDLRMPGQSGIEVARLVARSTPQTAVILYTAFGDRALLTEALDAGARGFVLKEAPLAELESTPASTGSTYVRPEATSSTARTTSASGASLSTNPRAPASSASVRSARSPKAV